MGRADVRALRAMSAPAKGCMKWTPFVRQPEPRLKV
jgi:hypothetical protein